MKRNRSVISGWLVAGALITVPSSAWAISRGADFNNDGVKDFAVAADQGYVYLYVGLNSGAYFPSAKFYHPADVAGRPTWRPA